MKRLVAIVLILLTLVILVGALLYWRWFDILHGNKESLYVSFWASLAEDVLFFLLVSLGLLIYTIRRPESEKFEAKVRFLFPSERAPIAFLAYNTAAIYKLGGFCTSAEKHILVTDYAPEIDAYKCYFTLDFRLQNMFTDQSYEDDVSIFVDADSFEKLSTCGQVLEVQFVPFQGHPVRFISQPLDLRSGERYERKIRISIPPNSDAEYFFRFWLWCRVGTDHYSQMRRFIAKYRCVLANKSDSDIRISLDSRESPVLTVRCNETNIIDERINTAPPDIQRFWWHRPFH
jgi:hypothetical protein